MSAEGIDPRIYYSYVPCRSVPGVLTDGEIRRELAVCTGERLEEVRAEIAARERIRARPVRRRPVRSVLDG